MGVIPCSKYGIACCKCFLLIGGRMWVECKWYFTVMAAMMNVKVAGSLFPCEESYQLVLWSSVYNSKNWPPLVVKVTRTGCYRSMTKTGGVQSVK